MFQNWLSPPEYKVLYTSTPLFHFFSFFFRFFFSKCHFETFNVYLDHGPWATEVFWASGKVPKCGVVDRAVWSFRQLIFTKTTKSNRFVLTIIDVPIEHYDFHLLSYWCLKHTKVEYWEVKTLANSRAIRLNSKNSQNSNSLKPAKKSHFYCRITW